METASICGKDTEPTENGETARAAAGPRVFLRSFRSDFASVRQTFLVKL